MFKNVFTKSMYDKRWFVFGWSLGMIAMIAITLAFFPSLSQGNSLDQLFANIPKQLQGLLGDLEAYKTATGYLGSAVFELRVPLIALPMAIILAIGLSVGEESNGQIYQLLARPISRSSIVVQKWLAFCVAIVIIHVAAFIGVVATLLAISEPPAFLIAGIVVLMSTLLCLAVGSFTMLLGFGTGKRALAVALSSVLAFGSYLITSFALQINWLKSIDYGSVFHYYQPVRVVKFGLDYANIAVLLSICAFSIVLAVILFSRRDIGLSS